jgi:hypothetical protein
MGKKNPAELKNTALITDASQGMAWEHSFTYSIKKFI